MTWEKGAPSGDVGKAVPCGDGNKCMIELIYYTRITITKTGILKVPTFEAFADYWVYILAL